MVRNEKRFPDGFFWGAATASYQVEGGIENNDWAQAARAGRVPECGLACDHFHRYEEDFALAQSLGHTAHRFSLEWARIEPEEGKFNEEAIEHYRQVIRSCRAHGMEPIVTLWHFTLPQWFADMGGFENRAAPEIFARYARYVAQTLGDEVQKLSTMNEPSVYASNGYLRGTWPPFRRFKLTDMVSITNSGKSYEPNPERGLKPLYTYLRVRAQLIRVHNMAYQAIKRELPSADVAIVKQVIVFTAAGWNPFHWIKAWFANWQWTHFIMSRVRVDSIGMNYYLYVPFGHTRQWKKTDMDWNFAPTRIYDALIMLKRYRKPIFITEAGLADHDDSDRAEYITKQVEATWRAIHDGVDVRGHLYWSLLDNYEWALGFEKRFGLIAIDYETLARTVRPSAYVYKEICERNAVVE
ncbi:MAG: family 1 glycosylhydrolase [Spirochaetes bacterium]|jgi:beta-glucosidase|nr:family 1 glycosylhydrolase [Spirochaetota bacterium]